MHSFGCTHLGAVAGIAEFKHADYPGGCELQSDASLRGELPELCRQHDGDKSLDGDQYYRVHADKQGKISKYDVRATQGWRPFDETIVLNYADWQTTADEYVS